MRVLLAASLLFALLATPVHATSNVTIHLLVNGTMTFPFDEPAFLARCDVSVPAGSDAGAILDAAKSAGCIDGWSFASFPGLGRFLTGVTGAGQGASTDQRNTDTVRFLCGAPNNIGGSAIYSFWAFAVNGLGSSTGIDGYGAAAGDIVSFGYIVDTCAFASSLAFTTAGVGPVSPVPLAGTTATDPGTAEL